MKVPDKSEERSDLSSGSACRYLLEFEFSQDSGHEVTTKAGSGTTVVARAELGSVCSWLWLVVCSGATRRVTGRAFRTCSLVVVAVVAVLDPSSINTSISASVACQYRRQPPLGDMHM